MKTDPNLRIVWDNAIDRGVLAASSEAGSLVASNLYSNLKSKVWRATSINESIVCSWQDPEPVGCVVLAFNNFTAGATMQVRGSTRNSDLIADYDSGPVLCAPIAGLGQFPWGMPLGENFYARGGASLFAYGYGGYGVVWVPGGYSFRKLEVLIRDDTNPDGYLEVGRVIAGPWWTPATNFSFNHNISFPELTQNQRTEAGDLRGEQAAMWKRIEFDLANMRSEDRAGMLRILRRHGINKPLFISLFPENTNPLLEQSYQLWGKFAETSKLAQPNYDLYTTQLAVEEM